MDKDNRDTYLFRMPKFGRRFYRYVLPTLAILIVACGAGAMAGKPDYQKQMELDSNKIADQLVTAVPYPLSDMRDSLERRQIRERLLRFNQKDKTGYLYLFNLGSNKPLGYYVIKGKVSATQSQMSNPNQTWKEDCGTDCDYGQNAESIGDDGSFGTDEGGENGIFFFDAQGVMHEVAGLSWVYTDAPSPLWSDVPSLNDEKSKPSSTSSQWKRNGGLGG